MTHKIEHITKLSDNPLEDFLNIEPGTTEIVKSVRVTELVEYADYDEKDKEIEDAYQEIADAAMTSFDELQEMVLTADTKLAIQLTMASNQMLNTALASLGRKAMFKENKDKLTVRKNTASKGGNNTNVLIMDRNDLLQKLREAREAEEAKNTIDVEVIEVKKDKE